MRCLTRLALHRHHLEARARTVPVGLILAWAKFGHVEHATHLARTLPDATRRAQAIAQLAEACSERGDLDVAGTLLDQAQDLLPQVTDDGLRDQITVALAWTAERIGQPARADDLVARILSTEEQVRASVLTARAALAAAAHDRTRQWCRRAEVSAGELSTSSQVQVLVWLCETWVQLGERAKAGHLLDAAVQLARGSPTWIVRRHLLPQSPWRASRAVYDTTAILAKAQSRVDDGDPATRSLAAATLAPALRNAIMTVQSIYWTRRRN